VSCAPVSQKKLGMFTTRFSNREVLD